MSTGAHSVRSSSVSSTNKTKLVHWPESHELTDVMEISTIQNIAIDEHPLLVAAKVDDQETQMAENCPNHEDYLPLIADLMDRSSAVENYFASEGDNGQEPAKPNIGENERQIALQELVTHLEDTAAMLRQYVAPPPADFMDHLSQSDKTNFLLRYQIVFVVFAQILIILILTLFDYVEHKDVYITLSKVIGAALQLFNMGVVIFATVVLSRQMLRHKVVGSFLAQTYVATVITFAGLYFIIYRIKNDSWEFGSIDKMEESLAVTQYIKMMYLSVSAATLCGAANIQPRVWYTVLILCFQSLINFVYFASILAQTIGNYNTYTVQVRRSASMSASGPRRHHK